VIIPGGDNAWNALAGSTFDLTYGGEHAMTFSSNPCNQATFTIGVYTNNIGGLGFTRTCINQSNIIIRATVELDSIGPDWWMETTDMLESEVDLRGTVVHEMGHVLNFIVPGGGHFSSGDGCGGVWTDDQTMCALLPAGLIHFRTLETHDRHTAETAY
jgi:hypothetical protein